MKNDFVDESFFTFHSHKEWRKSAKKFQRKRRRRLIAMKRDEGIAIFEIQFFPQKSSKASNLFIQFNCSLNFQK